ncbi:hypothetical protein [Henriciella aquimarina]|uniref:hypothetical protein n=1 Tax=Henriciella aquimarina TaxID=545261 RepID=UPI000A05F18A|nr:hypothetical protein [Henriciella aquimarina]
MLALVLLICLALGTAPLFSRGWISYGLLTAIPVLILGGMWVFDLGQTIGDPDSNAGAAITMAIYFTVCLMLVGAAVGRFATLGLKQWLGWRRSRTFVLELLPFFAPAGFYGWIWLQLEFARRPPAQACLEAQLPVSLDGHQTRLPLMAQLSLDLEEGYDVPSYHDRLDLTGPTDQRLACELTENGTSPLRLTGFEIVSTTRLGHDCPAELARWEEEYCRTDNDERDTFVPRSLSFETAHQDINDWFSGKVTSFGLYAEARENDGLNAIHTRRAARKGVEPHKSKFIFADEATTPSGHPVTVACIPFAEDTPVYRCQVRYEIRDGLYINYDFGVPHEEIPTVLSAYEHTARQVYLHAWPSD